MTEQVENMMSVDKGSLVKQVMQTAEDVRTHWNNQDMQKTLYSMELLHKLAGIYVRQERGEKL